jgi:HK97 gp10 family phage protein
MKVRVKFEGGQALAAALNQLSQRASKGVMRDALLSVAAPPMQAGMRARAARAPGAPDLADNIVVSVAPARGNTAAVIVGPSNALRADQPDKTFGEQGLYLEVGTEDTPMQAFARPTFDEVAPKVIAPIGAALWRELAGRGISRPTTDAPSLPSGPGGLV